LKQDFRLDHYEGRGWRGFHHYAVLCIAAYGFLMAERLIADKPVGGKKTSAIRTLPPIREGYIPRGSAARAATRPDIHPVAAPAPEL
jgi:SRSO17 transposase